MIGWIRKRYEAVNSQYPIYAKVVRFLISGGTATLTNLILLYVLTDFVRLWYVVSAIVAFVVAFFVSFILQKFWTFRDLSQENIHRQAVIYFLAALFNLCLNTVLLYVLVEYFGVHYMIAQFFVSAAIAIENYFIYQCLIFNRRSVINTP